MMMDVAESEASGSVDFTKNIVFPKFVLYPPDQSMDSPAISEKTSSVLIIKGVPKMMSEDDIKQLFERFGPILTININKETAYVIEFFDEFYASKAIFLSGYTIKVEDKDESDFTGILIIEYLQTENKNPECIDDSTAPLSKHDFYVLSKKLDHESTLIEATKVLTDWLKKGHCNARNTYDFYYLFQIANATTNKMFFEDKAIFRRKKIDAENNLNSSLSDIAEDLNDIGKVFNHENFNDLLSSLTELERKNLLRWKEEFVEASREIDAANRKKGNKKSKRSSKKKHRSTTNKLSDGELLRLKSEQEDLQLQLTVAQLTLENERIEQEERYNALKQSCLDAQKKCDEYEAQLADWRNIHAKLKKPESDDEVSDGRQGGNSLSNLDARLITSISAFLGDRPPGATLSDIRTYLRKKGFHITGKFIADLMRRFPALFKEVSQGSGPTMKIKWVFTGAEI